MTDIDGYFYVSISDVTAEENKMCNGMEINNTTGGQPSKWYTANKNNGRSDLGWKTHMTKAKRWEIIYKKALKGLFVISSFLGLLEHRYFTDSYMAWTVGQLMVAQ